MAKYFNREASSAMVSAGKLLRDIKVTSETPIYYATGIVEYEDYGLNNIVINCSDENGNFSQKLFIEKSLPSISPLSQFKVLYNMPLCFISIEYNLKGDNAVIYSSAFGLLTQALYAPVEEPIIIGAGKTYADGKVETGFALISKKHILNSPFLHSSADAIEIFRNWVIGEEA